MSKEALSKNPHSAGVEGRRAIADRVFGDHPRLAPEIRVEKVWELRSPEMQRFVPNIGWNDAWFSRRP